jgi:hypothetical protein
MSEPVHVINKQIVANGDMSTTISEENGNSLPIDLDYFGIVSYSVQAVFTGTPTGIIELQGSNDSPVNVGSFPTNWTPISESITNITAAGTYVVNYDLPAYSWVQLVYTPSGGSGTLNARFNGKRR